MSIKDKQPKPPKATKHQSFEIRDIHRSQIQNAPYNPRKINDYQRSGLKRNLKKVGLLQPLIWNELTGNMVSGHQRLSILDELERSEDYTLTVAVVNLDPTTEKEQNIFLNSTTFAGEFDFTALKNLLPDIDHLNAGLDLYDLNVIGVELETEQQTAGTEDEDEFFEDAKEKVKEAKRKASEAIEDRFDEGERYVTLSFTDYAAKAAFMLKYGLNPDDLYIKGEQFGAIIEKVHNVD